MSNHLILGILNGEQASDLDMERVALHRKGNVDYTDEVNVFSDDEDSAIDESNPFAIVLDSKKNIGR